eukprot:5026832-Pyramimonas_sp.AAC.1
MSKLVTETFGAVRTVRSFQGESKEIERFQSVVARTLVTGREIGNAKSNLEEPPSHAHLARPLNLALNLANKTGPSRARRTSVCLNIHTGALNIHAGALNIHTVALNIHTVALNIHT